MGKYQDFLYGEDTYGDRVRTEIPIRFQNLGYYIDGVGVERADVRLIVGPIPWDYANLNEETGQLENAQAQIAIVKGNIYYPPDPDRMKVDGEYADQAPLLLSDLKWENSSTPEDPNAGTWVPWSHSRMGQTFIFSSRSEDFGLVRPGTVLYIRVFVREKHPEITLPWDLRGEQFNVVPGNYGGIAGGMDALPRGVMTEGMVYGEHWDNGNAAFMGDLGYVLDTVTTDGELMIQDPEFIHPNMVLPMLRSFGMDPIEEGFFTDRSVSHRLKHILAHYRQITMAKGTMLGLSEYVQAVTGLPCRVAGPLNYLLDRNATCPDNYLSWPGRYYSDMYTIDCTAKAWLPQPTTYIKASERTRLANLPNSNRLHRWHNTWVDTWDGEPYLWGDVSGTRLGTVFPPPFWPNDLDDSFVDVDFPDPAIGWVHQFDVTATSRFGTKKLPGGSDWSLAHCMTLEDQRVYYMRFKVIGTGVTFTPTMFWLDKDGELLRRDDFSTYPGTTTWSTVGPLSATAPSGTKYMAWEVMLGGNGVGALGAYSVTDYIPAAFRDPRSIAVLLDTGEAATVLEQGTTMEDSIATMEDLSAEMEDSSIFDVTATSLDSWERVLISKLYGTLERYVPSGVQVFLLTPDDSEFYNLWGQGYQYTLTD